MFGRGSNNRGQIRGTKTIRCGGSDQNRGVGDEAQSRGGKAATRRAKATGGCEIGRSKGEGGAGEEDGGRPDGYRTHPTRTRSQDAGFLRCAKGRWNRR